MVMLWKYEELLTCIVYDLNFSDIFKNNTLRIYILQCLHQGLNAVCTAQTEDIATYIRCSATSGTECEYETKKIAASFSNSIQMFRLPKY